jgi:N-methylhydantoinase A
MLVGVDVGGTFTDIVAFDPRTQEIRHGKVLTTHGHLSDGIKASFRAIGLHLDGVESIRHGTTVVINTLLEGSGGPTALVTSAGFRDVLEIGRGNRPVMFDLFYRRRPPLVPRHLRFEIDERTTAAGEVVQVISPAQVAAVAAKIRSAGCPSVAISFINGYANPANENAVAEQIRDLLPDVFVSTGTQISRQWYEYERTATAVANAYVGPSMARYLHELRGELATADSAPRFYLMGSSGGAMTIDRASAEPINLVESGPVSGCIGAAAYGRALDMPKIIAFDMGGTTAKCALVEGEHFEVKQLYFVGGYDYGFPVQASVLNIEEVGAGGGSIAWLDEQGRLRLGPRSAGSVPGPACYGLGGSQPTVTDANLLLGRVNPAGFKGSDIRVDQQKAEAALTLRIVEPLGNPHVADARQAAQGILSLATAAMATAIRKITIERGRDPRDYVLFAYGGGGPLHAAEIARELHIGKVVIPPNAGVFSALGMLYADIARERARTAHMFLTDDFPLRAEQLFLELEREARAEFTDLAGDEPLSSDRSLEARYRGQFHALQLKVEGVMTAEAVRAAFERTYVARYRHRQPRRELEVVNFRLTLRRRVPHPDLDAVGAAQMVPGQGGAEQRMIHFGNLGDVRAAVYQRSGLAHGDGGPGPCAIEEHGATTLVGPGERFEVGRLGEIIITLRDQRSPA